MDFLLALMFGGKLILLSSLDSQAVCPHSLVQEPIRAKAISLPQHITCKIFVDLPCNVELVFVAWNCPIHERHTLAEFHGFEKC